MNGQSSGAHEINVGVLQGFLLDLTLFLLCINDLPRIVLRSLVNICSADTTVMEVPPKNQNVRSLAPNLASKLALTSQRELAGNFQ